MAIIRTSLALCEECEDPAMEGKCKCAVDMMVCDVCGRGPTDPNNVCGETDCSLSENALYDNTPVPPEFDDPDALLRHIASMADCRVCYPDGYDTTWKRLEGPSKLCSAHRDPILHALGYVYGWTRRGGMPQRLPGNDANNNPTRQED